MISGKYGSHLGDIISLELFRGKKFRPTVFIGNNTEAEIFVVERGPNLLGSSAVTISDSEGENFYIPRPDYEAAASHRSLQTLAIVAEVLNGAVSNKALPQVTTLTLAGGQ